MPNRLYFQIEQVAMVLAHVHDRELKAHEFTNFLHYVRLKPACFSF